MWNANNTDRKDEYKQNIHTAITLAERYNLCPGLVLLHSWEITPGGSWTNQAL